MGAILTILAVLAMYGLVYYLVTWINRIRTTRPIRCPADGGTYDVDFVHRTGALWEPGKVIDVVRCTAFEHPDDVTCNKACMRPEKKGVTYSGPPTSSP